MGTKRLPGEKIGGELTPMQRVDRAIKRNLAEQIKMIGGRLECMAGEVLTTGKAIITGERYPTKTIDFKRRPENTVVKAAGAKWTMRACRLIRTLRPKRRNWRTPPATLPRMSSSARKRGSFTRRTS
jgi:hypothetical protein